MLSPTEHGTFLSLNFGESDLRIALVSLNEELEFFENRIYPKLDKVKSASSEEVSYNDIIHVT